MRAIVLSVAALFALVTAAAFAVYGQEVVLVGEGADEIPAQNISFRLPDGQQVPVEEDDDGEGLIIRFPGDRAEAGEIVITMPDGRQRVIDAPAPGPGETLVVNVERGTAYSMPDVQSPLRLSDLPGPSVALRYDYLGIEFPDFGFGTELTGIPGDPSTEERPLLTSEDWADLHGFSAGGTFADPFTGMGDIMFWDIFYGEGDNRVENAVLPGTGYSAITYQERPFSGGPTGIFLGDTGLNGYFERDTEVFNLKGGMACIHPLGPRTTLTTGGFLQYGHINSDIMADLQSPTFSDIYQQTDVSLEQDYFGAALGGDLWYELKAGLGVYAGLYGLLIYQDTQFRSLQQNVCGLCGPANNFTSEIEDSDEDLTYGLKAHGGFRYGLTDRVALDVSGHATYVDSLGGFFMPTSGDDLFVDNRPAEVDNKEGVVGGFRVGLSLGF